VLDILVQPRRDKKAATTCFRKLLKECQYVPRVIITDKLASYGAAKRELLPSVEHRQHRYLNNRAENSNQPTCQRDRRMQGFKSSGHAQRFLSAYDPIAQHFRASCTQREGSLRVFFDPVAVEERSMRKRKDYFPCTLGTRVDQPTMIWLEREADKARMPVSTFVRSVIEAEAKRDVRQGKDRDAQD
jgi:hypothetical protein